MEKSAFCPMCRADVSMNYDSENQLDFSNRRWSIIEKDEINRKEYLEELDTIFVKSFEKLITE